MATTKVIEIISRVENILQDSNVRWPRLELQQWLNEAYLNIVLARPDANAVTGLFTCAVGTRQKLTTQFADGLRILDVVRNMSAGSTKTGRSFNTAVYSRRPTPIVAYRNGH